ncbi:hypothetical protein A3D43_00030 [Candidatus Nomurabacteria bacterium RIFCSPHIGHO2_02_FULL_41_52]|nr:MAG: hypothetical protein A3D43_00030 [Candidatus Nomurabacteria bacterium RIFCSPHIGHO2_02_FULL_41_52]
MPKKKQKINAKDVFDRYFSGALTGASSNETINIFCNTDNNYFANLAKKYKLQERQIASVVGFKDEFFVELLINQIIKENKLENKFYCKKVTANQKSGISSRTIKLNDKEVTLTIGGDCVIFKKEGDRPIMIIECKEYIDMIRMKELIGESSIVKDTISNSAHLLGGIKFCVFAEVLELTDGWAYLLKNSDLKHEIDEIFIVRDGKRKNKANKPVRENLEKFKSYIQNFLLEIKQMN